MDTYEAIRKRRSVRFYTNEPISDDKVKRVVKAALWAPSGHRMYPTRIVIVQKQEAIGRINGLHKGIHGNNPHTLLVLCRDKRRGVEEWYWPGLDEQGRLPPSLEHVVKVARMDIAIAAQNVCLMATDLDIGSIIIADCKTDAVREILGLSEDYIPELMVCLGYQDKARDKEFMRTVAKQRPMKRSFEHTVIGWIRE